jgi:hypothetical protein
MSACGKGWERCADGERVRGGDHSTRPTPFGRVRAGCAPPVAFPDRGRRAQHEGRAALESLLLVSCSKERLQKWSPSKGWVGHALRPFSRPTQKKTLSPGPVAGARRPSLQRDLPTTTAALKEQKFVSCLVADSLFQFSSVSIRSSFLDFLLIVSGGVSDPGFPRNGRFACPPSWRGRATPV